MKARLVAATMIVIGTVAATTVIGCGLGLGLRINLTPSYPRGLWQIVALDRSVEDGDLVFICPPNTDTFRQALERGYIRRGLCAGAFSPLIKTVVGIGGQNVAVTASVSIDGHPLAYSELRRVDGAGRTLEPDSGGIIPADQLYLHSNFGASYDSRYFGPIPTKGVLGLARPIFVFHP